MNVIRKAAAAAIIIGSIGFAGSASAATEHCPDHNGHPGKVEGTNNDTVLPEGTVFCVKGSTDATGVLTADGVTDLVTYLGNGHDVSYYVVYETPTTTVPPTTEPPTTEPPTTEPPVTTEPPTTEPPVTVPPGEPPCEGATVSDTFYDHIVCVTPTTVPVTVPVVTVGTPPTTGPVANPVVGPVASPTTSPEVTRVRPVVTPVPATLPVTGIDSGTLARLAAVLLLVGGGIVWTTRRKVSE